MNVTAFEALACPLDGFPLRRVGSTWRCPAGHSHDIARQGHVHLLPVQQKRSRDPGDSREMVAARRRFLNSGAYGPIAAAVSRALDLRDRQSIADLLAMTPHLYRASATRRAQVGQLAVLSVTVDVHLAQLRRDASG